MTASSMPIEPRNALAGTGDEVHLPDAVRDAEVGAAPGAVIGREAGRNAGGRLGLAGPVAGRLSKTRMRTPHLSLGRRQMPRRGA